jgi:hypothetical protein
LQEVRFEQHFDLRPCELIARSLREKCREQFVRRYESDPAVVGDASQTKATARRWKTSEFATTFVKRKVDRFESAKTVRARTPTPLA